MKGARKKLAKRCEDTAKAAIEEVKHLVEGLRSKRRERAGDEVTNPSWPPRRAQVANRGSR